MLILFRCHSCLAPTFSFAWNEEVLVRFFSDQQEAQQRAGLQFQGQGPSQGQGCLRQGKGQKAKVTSVLKQNLIAAANNPGRNMEGERLYPICVWMEVCFYVVWMEVCFYVVWMEVCFYVVWMEVCFYVVWMEVCGGFFFFFSERQDCFSVLCSVWMP